MGEDDVIHLLGINHRIAVGCVGLQAFALEHTAVEQDLLPVVCSDKVLTSSDFLGCTDKFDLHGKPIWIITTKIEIILNQAQKKSRHY